MNRKDYIANLNAMNRMTDEERRAHLVNQTFMPMFNSMFAPNKAADQLPDGCDGCREEIGGLLICCVNQTDED